MFRKKHESMSGVGKVLPKVFLMAAALVVVGCDGHGEASVSLTDFNLLEISAANTSTLDSADGSAGVRLMTVSWDNAVSGGSLAGVSYTVCQYDDTQTGNCLVLGEVTDATEATVELDSLLEAVSSSYFVMASYEDQSASTSNISLDADTIIDMIGYFKPSNTQGGDNFGFSVALSADGMTLAVGSYGEDSAATGVNGSQIHDSETDENYASASGAVYIYSYYAGSWSQVAYVKASNSGASDNFGRAISLSDDGLTLAVGAHSEDSDGSDQASSGASASGAVYVFESIDGTDWAQTAYVKASNAGPTDFFSFTALGLSGDGSTLAVGAYFEDSDAVGTHSAPTETGTVSASGAVYIYTKTDSAWPETAYIKASNAEENDYFGAAVAMDYDGDVLTVGAYGEDSDDSDQSNNDASSAGAVYVFALADDSWTQTDYLKASNVEASDNFGRAIALDNAGDTLAVAAYLEDSAATGINGEQTETEGDEDNDIEGVNYARSAGAVYIFDYDGTSWNQTAYVKASNTEASDEFGEMVALSSDGNRLVVSATGDDSASTGINGVQTETEDDEDNSIEAVNYASKAGAVYVFEHNGTSWSQTAYVKASNTNASDEFGISFAINDDASALAIGANKEDSASTGINGNQVSADEVEEDDVVVSEAVNFASSAGAVYLY